MFTKYLKKTIILIIYILLLLLLFYTYFLIYNINLKLNNRVISKIEKAII